MPIGNIQNSSNNTEYHGTMAGTMMVMSQHMMIQKIIMTTNILCEKTATKQQEQIIIIKMNK